MPYIYIGDLIYIKVYTFHIVLLTLCGKATVNSDCAGQCPRQERLRTSVQGAELA